MVMVHRARDTIPRATTNQSCRTHLRHLPAGNSAEPRNSAEKVSTKPSLRSFCLPPVSLPFRGQIEPAARSTRASFTLAKLRLDFNRDSRGNRRVPSGRHASPTLG